MEEALWPPLKVPGDIASHMLRHMVFYGTATVPQKLIDMFGGHQEGLGTHVVSGSGWTFQLVGNYIGGSEPYNQTGTVSVDSFGMRLLDEDGAKLYWIDFDTNGNTDHTEMHYHEPGWEGGLRVYSSRDPENFWRCIEKWQSEEYTRYLSQHEGDKNSLFSL